MIERTDVPLAELLEELSARKSAEKFEPFAWYDRHEDTLEFYFKREAHIAERADGRYTVLVSRRDREKVVGFVIKKIRKHFGSLFIVAFKTDRASVRLFLLGAEFMREERLVRTHQEEGASVLSPDSPLHRILNDFGDTEVLLANREEAVAYAA